MSTKGRGKASKTGRGEGRENRHDANRQDTSISFSHPLLTSLYSRAVLCAFILLTLSFSLLLLSLSVHVSLVQGALIPREKTFASYACAVLCTITCHVSCLSLFLSLSVIFSLRLSHALLFGPTAQRRTQSRTMYVFVALSAVRVCLSFFSPSLRRCTEATSTIVTCIQPLVMSPVSFLRSSFSFSVVYPFSHIHLAAVGPLRMLFFLPLHSFFSPLALASHTHARFSMLISVFHTLLFAFWSLTRPLSLPLRHTLLIRSLSFCCFGHFISVAFRPIFSRIIKVHLTGAAGAAGSGAHVALLAAWRVHVVLRGDNSGAVQGACRGQRHTSPTAQCLGSLSQ